MARDFTRPELRHSPQLLAELIPDTTRILINPDWEDLRGALRAVQTGCRKNKLLEAQIKNLLRQSREPDFTSIWVGTAEELPPRYPYEFAHSQAAACWLGDNLVGFLIQRVKTPPDSFISAPIYPLHIADEDYDPRGWFESVCATFWTQLRDDEIETLRLHSTLQMILIRDRERWREDRVWRERHLRRLRRRPLPPEILHRRWKTLQERWEREWQEYDRRRKEKDRLRQLREAELQRMLLHLLRGTQPTYASRLRDACVMLGERLLREGRETISWHEVKKQWPSLAMKYARYFVERLEDGRLTRTAILLISDAPIFTLSLGVWDGTQRLFDEPQLVFRINAEHVYYSFAHTYQDAMKAINEALFMNAEPWHPADKWSVGWLRVHVDEENLIAFVDEVQADALEVLRDSKKQLDPKVIAEVEKILRPWNLHGFATVRSWAHKIGYRAALHSKELLQLKLGATRSKRKWNTYYQPIISNFGLHQETVAGYPAPIMIEPWSVSSPEPANE